MGSRRRRPSASRSAPQSGLATTSDETRRPELVCTSPRWPLIDASFVPSGDHAADVAATEKRCLPSSPTTWTRPSYAPVAKRPVVDQPTGLASARDVPRVLSRRRERVDGAVVRLHGDEPAVRRPCRPEERRRAHECARRRSGPGEPERLQRMVVPARRVDERPAVRRPGQLDVVPGREALRRTRVAGRRRSRRSSRRRRRGRSLTNATSLPFGETTGFVSCQGLCVRFTTRPFQSAR